MEVKEHIQYWLDSAEHDWDVAKNLYDSGKYDWCLFIGHLVLEKTLKALFVQDNNNQLPPKTHNLVKLVKRTGIMLSEEQIVFLDEVNDFNIETRYPQYKNELYKRCTKEFAENYYLKIEAMAEWLRSQRRQD